MHLSSSSNYAEAKVLASREFDSEDVYANWPSYEQLPLDPSYPTKAAWGVGYVQC
jgi:hypothetical protein